MALSGRALRLTTKFWFIIFLIGQLIFAWYIFMLYWKSAALGEFEKWNSATPHLYIKGQAIRNIVFGLHAAIAGIISVIGPLQLVPQIRKYAPAYHRMSGRLYVIVAFLISIDGIYLTWRKGAVGDFPAHVVISINAFIIMICGYFTIRYAIKRNLKAHHQWAVHLLLAMSGVWLFRVFLMFWLIINGGPVGFDPDTFSGPFLNVLAVLVYIFPQALVAYYFKARNSNTRLPKVFFSILITLITIGMTIGIIAATLGMWLPRLN